MKVDLMSDIELLFPVRVCCMSLCSENASYELLSYLIHQTKETFIIQFRTTPKKRKVLKSFNSPCVL